MQRSLPALLAIALSMYFSAPARAELHDPVRVLSIAVTATLDGLKNDPDFARLGTDGFRRRAVRDLVSLVLMGVAHEPERIAPVVRDAELELGDSPVLFARELLDDAEAAGPEVTRAFHQAAADAVQTFGMRASFRRLQSMRRILDIGGAKSPPPGTTPGAGSTDR